MNSPVATPPWSLEDARQLREGELDGGGAMTRSGPRICLAARSGERPSFSAACASWS